MEMGARWFLPRSNAGVLEAESMLECSSKGWVESAQCDTVVQSGDDEAGDKMVGCSVWRCKLEFRLFGWLR